MRAMRTVQCRQENEVAIVKRILFATCVVLAATWGSTATFAASQDRHACTGVDRSLPQARKQEYAGLVAAALDQKIKPSEVTVDGFLSGGSWSVAYANVPITDPGYFFFQTVEGRKQFKDVWGGMADPSDRPEIIAWVKKLGAPASFAACLADTVIGE